MTPRRVELERHQYLGQVAGIVLIPSKGYLRTNAKRHRYGKRSLVETAIFRIKRINDGRLTSRTFGAQQNEVAIHIKIANRAMQIARPLSERVR